MTRTSIRRLLLGLAVFFCFPVPTLFAKQDPPNVLVIMVEDLNEWIGFLGGPRITPNIDRLAASSHQFMNAYTVCPTCNASRVAMLTGQRPSVNGIAGNLGNFRDLPGGDKRQTLPQYMRQHGGHSTVSAGKIFHHSLGDLSDPLSWDIQNGGYTGVEGWPHYVDENENALWLEGEETPNVYLNKYSVWGYGRRFNGELQATEDTPEWGHVDFVDNFLQEDHDSPFFVALGLTAPHQPLIAPKEFFDQINSKYPYGIPEPFLPEHDLDDVSWARQYNSTTPLVELVKSKNQLGKAVEAYLSTIAFSDAAVGQVIDSLENSQYADNTIVVLVSDHGFQLGHKSRWEKFELWKQSSKVPLLIKTPGQTRGKRIVHSVSLLDLYPTLTELAGLPKNKDNQGDSLVDMMERPLAQPISSAVVNAIGHLEFRHDYGVHQEGWNYILRDTGEEELYNHATDPLELYNVSHLEANDHRKRRMASEVVRTAIQVANRDLDFEELKTLGDKTAEDFERFPEYLDEHSQWETLRYGNEPRDNDFEIVEEKVNSVSGRLLAQYEMELRSDHDFVLATDVELSHGGVGAGIAFGIQDAENYYEFLVNDAQFSQQTDVTVRRWVDGVPQNLFVETGLPNIPSDSSWNLIASYNSFKSLLTLSVLDESKNTYFKEEFELNIREGTKFGISSFYHGFASFDNFRLTVIPELPLPTKKHRVALNCFQVYDMEHIDTFEHIGQANLTDLDWTIQDNSISGEAALQVAEGQLKSQEPESVVIATRNEPLLVGTDDFQLVAKLRMTGEGDSAGVVFFHHDVENYFQFNLVDRNVREGVDVELIRWINGRPRVLVSDSTLSGIQYGHEYVIYLQFSRGRITIEVIDSTEESLFFEHSRLLRRLDSSRFGIAVDHHGNCEFDYFRVVSGLRASPLVEQCYKLD